VIDSGVRQLADFGPSLGRPLVDRIKGSRHHNMKELRSDRSGENLRVLFVFDPRRTAILLLGGDKSGAWREWYDTFIPIADDLYDIHLQEIGGQSHG
jgi:hypothetical protein